MSGSLMVTFNAGIASILDLENHQFSSTIGNYGDACKDQDRWSYKDGLYTLVFNDVWDGSGSSTAYDPGNFTSAYEDCPSFQLTDVGFSWGYPTKTFIMEIDMRTVRKNKLHYFLSDEI